MTGGFFSIEALKERDLPAALDLLDAGFADAARWLVGRPPAGRSEGVRVGERFYRPNTPAVVLRSEGGTMEGVCFLQVAGTRAAGGPLAIRPAYDTRIASRAILTASALSAMKLGAKAVDVVTFPHSPTHLTMYFSLSEPLFPTTLVTRSLLRTAPSPVRASVGADLDVVALSTLADDARVAAVAATKEITAAFTAGFDLTSDIAHVLKRSLGECFVVRAGSEVVAFAVCHFGPRSEAFSDEQYLIKHIYVSPRVGGALDESRKPRTAAMIFERLIGALETDGRGRGSTSIALMVSTARRPMLKFLFDRGYTSVEVFAHWAARLPEAGQPVRCLGNDLASIQSDQFGGTELR